VHPPEAGKEQDNDASELWNFIGKAVLKVEPGEESAR